MERKSCFVWSYVSKALGPGRNQYWRLWQKSVTKGTDCYVNTLSPSNLPMFRSLFFILICVVLAGGCAKIEQPIPKTALTFPKGRIAVDAVGLELGVAQLDSSQSETFDEFWRMLDQQELPLQVRQMLDANGIRVAVMASHAPTAFNQLVDVAVINPEVLNEFESQLHAKGMLRPQRRMVTHQRISNREGQAHEVVTSVVHPEASWVIKSGETQTAGFGQQVRGLISITTYPRGDGSVRLVVRPEIHHGQERARIGVGESSFLFQSGQHVTAIDELKFEVNLRSGESLVIAPTADNSGVGKLLFGNATDGLEIEAALNEQKQEKENSNHNRPVPLHRMMMVRVVQTQMDDLFSNANLGEKLSTNPIR